MPDNDSSNHNREESAGRYLDQAIAHIAPSSSNQQVPRNPRNLQGLLRFATELTRNEDAPGPSMLLPMDDERRKFLEEAINSLTIDTTSEMQTSIDILGNTKSIAAISCDSPVPDDVLQAFDSLTDIVINMDMSIGFYKMGGYRIIPVCLSCENAEVRSQACQLLAEICQNNIFCQTRALENGFVHIILDILMTDGNDKVLKSALYAISCMIREHEQCAKTFLSEGGCTVLVKFLKSSVSAHRNKAAFIICSTYSQYPEMRENASDLIQALTVGLKMVEDNAGHLLNAVSIIISNGCSQDDEGNHLFKDGSSLMYLKEETERHMKCFLDDFTMYAEEIGYCKIVLKYVNKLVKKRSGGDSRKEDNESSGLVDR